MPATLDLPSTFHDLPTIDEDDVCHILLGNGPKTMCGAPYDCEKGGMEEYRGQEVCSSCHRLVCPACVEATGRDERRAI